MTLPAKARAANGLSVLLVDSDPAFVGQGCQVIAAEGHRAWGAVDLLAAANFLADHRPDLMVVELDLLEADGADPFGDIRARSPGIPTLISAHGPPDERFRELHRTHEIYGYLDKTHGSVGLRLWVGAALTGMRYLRTARDSRRGLKQVIGTLPELSRIRPVQCVLETINAEVRRIIPAECSFVAARVGELVGGPGIERLGEAPPRLEDFVIASTDREEYPVGLTLDRLEPAPRHLLRRAVEERSNVVDDRHGVLSLSLAKHVLGLIYLKAPKAKGLDTELLRVFATHSAAAIRAAALYELATVDSTTLVYRKSFAVERLRETLKLAWRRLFPLTVLIADIDRFKQVNDEHGHVVGDRVLRHVAQLLKANVRDSDIVGRFGGDEFLLVLIDADVAGARIVADRLRAATMATTPGCWSAGAPGPQVSIGQVTLEPGEGWPGDASDVDLSAAIDRMIQEADTAMYRARREGKGVVAEATLTWLDFAREVEGPLG
jgi:diguanylate cyclase (GGDEF)-like protein